MKHWQDICFRFNLLINEALTQSSNAVGTAYYFLIEQALHASWEPRHSRYCHRFPWQQYVKVGAVLRQFGYTVVALHGCLRTEIQVTSE